MTQSVIFFRLSLLLVSGLMLPASLHAQSMPLEEIVVSAQKREQLLNEVPISVNVIRGDLLERSNVDRLQDLAARTPSLNIAESATGDQIFMRGVGSAVNPGFEQSVGTFIDGVFHGRDAQSRGRFLDIERIEILRGPQSTYFGNNTIGGALNVITRGPGEKFEGHVRGMYGPSDDDREVAIAFGGPLSDTFGARVAFRWAGYDGFIRNDTRNRNEDQQESFSGRITAVWSPNDRFNATVKAEHHVFHQNGVAKEEGQCPPNPPFPGPQLTCGRALALQSNGILPSFEDDLNGVSHRGAVFMPANIPGPPSFPVDPAALVAFDEFFDLDSTTVGLTMNWDVAGHTITSVTGYSGYDFNRSTDIDNLPVAAAGINDPTEWDQFSQELRIASATGGRLEYIAGVYYQHGELFSDEIFVFPLALGIQSNTLFDQEEETISAFGALTWNITGRLRGTVGLRYTDVDKTLDWTQTVSATTDGNPRTVAANPALDGFPNFGKFSTPETRFKRSDDDLNPSVNLQFDVNDDIMTYFSFAQGFKAGGFDQRADTTATFDDISFNPEEVDAFEVGAKSRWLDGRLEFNLALFRMEYDDLQVSSLGPSGVSFVVTNAASAISQGVEVDARWAITDGLTLSTAFSFLDATFDEWLDGPCNAIEVQTGNPASCQLSPATADRSGDDLPFAPDFSGNVMLDHVYHFTNGIQFDTQLLVFFTTKVMHRIDNDPRLVENGFIKLDARAELSRGPWSLAFIGKNLTDNKSLNLTNRLVASSGSIYRQRDRDRHFLIQAGYNF